MRYVVGFGLLVMLLSCDSDKPEVQRPKDVWAFRSVLDRKPRMLTLALNNDCYAAYDLANCTLYRVWKGGVDLQGAAYTDKKNVQPVSWGTPYSDSLHTRWVVSHGNRPIGFSIRNKGYRFMENQVYIRYEVVAEEDTFYIEERPEYLLDENGNPGLERRFIVEQAPDGIAISIASPTDQFQLKGGASTLVTWFKPLPAQQFRAPVAEYDHRGRYYMEKSDCFTCHETDRTTVGPAFAQIAARYRKQEGATRRLISKVRNGGSGNWGGAAMNAHPGLTDAEINAMLDYIYSLVPSPVPPSTTAVSQTMDSSKSSPGFGAPLESVHPSYDVQTIHKSDFRPRVGGLAFTKDGSLLVTTWDSVGAVYKMSGVHTGDTGKIVVTRIASGLAEPLGIEVVNDEIYVLQKQELTRLLDNDNDGVTDEYRVVCNSWGVTDDFHEFAFGLVYRDGYLYATLSMAMRLMSTERQRPDRGKTIRISTDGSYEPINYGLRTPNGIGVGPEDQIFVTDNQGEWVPANKMVHVKQGEYHGMRWGHLDTTTEPPAVAPPAIWLPENEIGNSPSEPVLIKEGIYKGQMLHGDVTYGGIQRDFIEKVNGEFQGAVFRFTQGLEGGVNRMRFGPDGAIYVGCVGMVGGWSWKEKQYGLQRLVYNGKPVFDMLAIRSRGEAFEIEFTEPVAPDIALRPADLRVEQWWYLPREEYGGPKKDHEQLKIRSMQFSADRKKMTIELHGLKDGRVVYFRLPEFLRSQGGRQLWSGEAWYALNVKRQT